jgi:membrane protein required for colicin V production
VNGDLFFGLGWIDLAFGSVVLLSLLVGLVRGLVSEVLSLMGWVVAYVAAQAFTAQVAPVIPVGSQGSPLNTAVTFVLIFVAVLMAWSFLSWMVRKLVQASPLSPFDRVLGGAFGLARGVLVALVIATAVSLTPLAQSPAWQASQGVAGLQKVLSGLKPHLPADLARHLRVAQLEVLHKG